MRSSRESVTTMPTSPTLTDAYCPPCPLDSLQILWNRFPQFGPENTVHIDDLQRFVAAVAIEAARSSSAD